MTPENKAIIVSKTCNSKMEMMHTLIEHYYTTLQKKCSDIDKKVLAYYLIYGINKKCDKMVVEEVLSHLAVAMARQTIYNVRQSLKNDGVITFNEVRRVYEINPPMNLNFKELDDVVYALKITQKPVA